MHPACGFFSAATGIASSAMDTSSRSVILGQSFRCSPQAVGQQQEPVSQCRMENALLLPSPWGSCDAPGNNADSAPFLPDPSHESHVLHDRNLRIPAQAQENISPDEDGLVAVGDAGETGPERGNGCDAAVNPARRINAQIEGAPQNAPVLHNQADPSQGIVGQACVCVKKDKDIACGDGCSGVHLNGSARRGGNTMDFAFRDGPPRVFFFIAVYYNEFALLSELQLP